MKINKRKKKNYQFKYFLIIQNINNNNHKGFINFIITLINLYRFKILTKCITSNCFKNKLISKTKYNFVMLAFIKIHNTCNKSISSFLEYKINYIQIIQTN